MQKEGCVWLVVPFHLHWLRLCHLGLPSASVPIVSCSLDEGHPTPGVLEHSSKHLGERVPLFQPALAPHALCELTRLSGSISPGTDTCQGQKLPLHYKQHQLPYRRRRMSDKQVWKSEAARWISGSFPAHTKITDKISVIHHSQNQFQIMS